MRTANRRGRPISCGMGVGRQEEAGLLFLPRKTPRSCHTGCEAKVMGRWADARGAAGTWPGPVLTSSRPRPRALWSGGTCKPLPGAPPPTGPLWLFSAPGPSPSAVGSQVSVLGCSLGSHPCARRLTQECAWHGWPRPLLVPTPGLRAPRPGELSALHPHRVL